VSPLLRLKNPTIRTARQRELIEVLSLQRHPKAGEIIEAASGDDLVWLQLMIEYQLGETPHHVTNESDLERAQGWHRHLRTIVGGALHNKRSAERRRERVRRLARDLVFLLLGVVLAWVLSHIEF